jgi:hypothetical protein
MSRRAAITGFVLASLAMTGIAAFPGRAIAQTTRPSLTLSGVACLGPTVCMAAGTYDSDAGVDQPIIEKWNQRGGWKLMRLPALPAGSSAATLTTVSCSGPDFCIALGTYLAAGAGYPDYTPFGFVWRGSRWSLTALPQPAGAPGSQITGLSCTTPTSCLAVGYVFATPTTGLTEQWNGSAWTSSAGPDMDAVSCVAPTNCTGVGRIVSSGPDSNESVVVDHWGGTSWSPEATLASGDLADDSYGPLQISCVGANCMVAGGVADDLADIFPVAWRSNRTSWSATPTPPLGGGYGSGVRYSFQGISCVGRARCTAVGNIIGVSGTAGYVNLAERWNGSVWAVQSTPPNPPAVSGSSFLVGVSCADGRNCLAVGIGNDAALHKTIQSFADRWTTTGWTSTTAVALPPA